VAKLLELAGRMDLRMTGDYSLDQGRAGPGLSDNKNRGRIVVPCGTFRHPFVRERISKRLVHFDFGLLIEFDRAVSSFRTTGKGLERIVPVFEILEFLAEPVIEKCERAWITVFLFCQALQFLDVVTVRRFANIGQKPVGLWIGGLRIKYLE
jgi:hypothetical protein